MRVYISGALKSARSLEAARRLYEHAARAVEMAGHDPYLPHSKTDPERDPGIDSVEVFEQDVSELRRSDAMIAFLDEPSLGVGAELAISAQMNIPVLVLHRSDADVSRFALGCVFSSGGERRVYEDWTGVENEITSYLSEGRRVSI